MMKLLFLFGPDLHASRRNFSGRQPAYPASGRPHGIPYFRPKPLRSKAAMQLAKDR